MRSTYALQGIVALLTIGASALVASAISGRAAAAPEPREPPSGALRASFSPPVPAPALGPHAFVDPTPHGLPTLLPPPAAASSLPFPMPTPNADEARKERLARLEQFREERVEPRWATHATQSLGESLGALAEANGFHVVSTTCKTVTCGVELEWPSYTAARGSLTLAAQASLTPNCATQVSMPPPDDPSRAYRATMLLDCTGFRVEHPDW